MRHIATLSALLILAYGAPVFAVGESSACPPGSRPATAMDAAVQNGQISAGTCYNQNDADIGKSQEGAKKELAKMWCGGKPPSCGSNTGSVEKLDPKFAQCALKFLKAARKKDKSICMASAYRSAAHQACVCKKGKGKKGGGGPCAAPGKSQHQQGKAIDIEKKGTKKLPPWVHKMAGQFGIEFPVKNDDGHFEPKGGRSKVASAGGGASDAGSQGGAGGGGGGGGDCSSSNYNPQGGDSGGSGQQQQAGGGGAGQ